MSSTGPSTPAIALPMSNNTPKVLSPENARIYLGVDPGVGGAIAKLKAYSYGPHKIYTMPLKDRTERDIWNKLVRINSNSPPDFALIEKVQGYIGGEGHPGTAMFKFGMSYGGLRMALIASSIPFEEVTPQKWQKGLGIVTRKKSESKVDFKRRLKARAEQLFPSVRVTLVIADALLIAEYCRRLRTVGDDRGVDHGN